MESRTNENNQNKLLRPIPAIIGYRIPRTRHNSYEIQETDERKQNRMKRNKTRNDTQSEGQRTKRHGTRRLETIDENNKKMLRPSPAIIGFRIPRTWRNSYKIQETDERTKWNETEQDTKRYKKRGSEDETSGRRRLGTRIDEKQPK